MPGDYTALLDQLLARLDDAPPDAADLRAEILALLLDIPLEERPVVLEQLLAIGG